MKTDRFDFHLPEQLIAQEPLPQREAARLLHIDRNARAWQDRKVTDFAELLRPGDLLVLNNTRVIPARLRAVRDTTGGKVEFLLLPPEARDSSSSEESVVRRVLTKSGGKLSAGEQFTVAGTIKAILRERRGEPGDVVEFQCSQSQFQTLLEQHGEVPLPPYIRRAPGPSTAADRERYQTVFARTPGAVAAPTAGFHFSEALLGQLEQRGVQQAYVTLHVGPGTFKPVKAENVAEHYVDPEPYFIPATTVAAVQRAKKEKRRVIPVGTTSLRSLEGAIAIDPDLLNREPSDLSGQTDLYVHPPYQFKIANALITNFHVPKSSLLMLVCAFAAPGSEAGIDFIKSAYEHAVKCGYRFYSYGDACFLE